MVSVQDVIDTTASYYGFTVGELLSENRGQPLAFVRQIAMRLSRDLTAASYPEIARKFNNRDHTTIIHGCRKVESKAASDPGFEAEYRHLMSEVVLGNKSASVTSPAPAIKIYRKGLYSKWKRCQY